MTATTWPRTPGYDDAVDLDRYPINAPASPAYRPWSRRAGTSSAATGSPSWPGCSPRPPSDQPADTRGFGIGDFRPHPQCGALPTLTVSTSDGYRPGLDDTIAFATEGSR